MEITCSGFGFGSECNFTCLPGYPIQGSSIATCELTGADPPDVFWDYGQDGEPICTCKDTLFKTHTRHKNVFDT